eukprot:613311-Prymnesium_polylepis.1
MPRGLGRFGECERPKQILGVITATPHTSRRATPQGPMLLSDVRSYRLSLKIAVMPLSLIHI